MVGYAWPMGGGTRPVQNYRRGTRTADATGRSWAQRSRFGRPLRVLNRPARARKKAQVRLTHPLRLPKPQTTQGEGL